MSYITRAVAVVLLLVVGFRRVVHDDLSGAKRKRGQF